jgi:hypothetical protein
MLLKTFDSKIILQSLAVRRNNAGKAALNVLAMDARSAVLQYLAISLVNNPVSNTTRWNRET